MTIGPLPGEKVLWRLVIYCPQYLRNRREFEFLLCQLCSAWSLLLTAHNYENILNIKKQKLLAGVTLISFLAAHSHKNLLHVLQECRCNKKNIVTLKSFCHFQPS